MASSIDVTVYDDSTLMLKIAHLYEERGKPVASKTIHLHSSSKSIRFSSQYMNPRNPMLLLIDCIDFMYTPTDYEVILKGSTDNRNIVLPSLPNTGSIGHVLLQPRADTPQNSATVLIRFKNGVKFNRYLSLFNKGIVASRVPTESHDDYYNKGIGLDVSIVINDNIIKASKYVLGIHSPVFKAMFENDWKDSRENLIEINDIEYDVMLLFVKSIHSVPIQLYNTNVAFQLIIVADKYNVIDIKQQVERFVIEGINKDNAINIVTLAHNLNIECIKREALNFITSQKYEKIEELQDHDQMSSEISLLILNETRNAIHSTNNKKCKK